MCCNQVEMVHGDATALVHLSHRGTAVLLWAAQRGCQELDLSALQPRHAGSGEKPGQRVVVKDSSVKVVDDGFQCLGSTDLLVDTRHAPRKYRPRFASIARR